MAKRKVSFWATVSIPTKGKKILKHKELEELWNEYEAQTGMSLTKFKYLVTHILNKKSKISD